MVVEPSRVVLISVVVGTLIGVAGSQRERRWRRCIARMAGWGGRRAAAVKVGLHRAGGAPRKPRRRVGGNFVCLVACSGPAFWSCAPDSCPAPRYLGGGGCPPPPAPTPTATTTGCRMGA